MRKLCSSAQVLWEACVNAVNSGTLEEYQQSWKIYIDHKHTCAECQVYLDEFYKRYREYWSKKRAQAWIA